MTAPDPPGHAWVKVWIKDHGGSRWQCRLCGALRPDLGWSRPEDGRDPDECAELNVQRILES